MDANDSVNAEVLALTYGAIVRQLLADLNDVESVNKQLKQMGTNIGVRLIEEFLARTGVERCLNFQQTCKNVAELGLPMFLGVKGMARPGNSDKQSIIVLREMPLAEFVEIPARYQGLKYCNLVAGVIEGALSRVNLEVRCEVVKDMLMGAQEYELSLQLLHHLGPEQYPFSEAD